MGGVERAIEGKTGAARGRPVEGPAAARDWNPSDRGIAALFLLPTVALLAVTLVFPLLWAFALSLTRFSATRPQQGMTWVGAGNYLALLSSESVWAAFGTTAAYVGLAVGLEFLLGFGLALLLNRAFPGRGLVSTILLLPMMLTPAIASTFWVRFLFHPQSGMFNYYLAALRLPAVDWLGTPRNALLSLILVDLWQWTPFMLLIALAALSAVPRYLYEAAEVDQASGWFKFTQITLPMAWPLLLVGLLFRTMDAVRLFDYQLATSGYGQGTRTIARTLYNLAFYHWDTGLSAALGCLLLVLTLALASLYVRALKRAGAA